MKVTIKNRWTGVSIIEGNFASIAAAIQEAANKKISLFGANLSGADLSEANLSEANLSEADLSGANLFRADLSGANLFGANLFRADLSGVRGFNKYLTTNLYMLYAQPGKIRAYKLVNEAGEGPQHGGIKYEIGGSYSVDSACCDEAIPCGSGINLATLDWVLHAWLEGYRILIAEFEAKDIAAIPIGSDGKFRVHRCTIVGEKDLKELGLVEE